MGIVASCSDDLIYMSKWMNMRPGPAFGTFRGVGHMTLLAQLPVNCHQLL